MYLLEAVQHPYHKSGLQSVGPICVDDDPKKIIDAIKKVQAGEKSVFALSVTKVHTANDYAIAGFALGQSPDSMAVCSLWYDEFHKVWRLKYFEDSFKAVVNETASTIGWENPPPGGMSGMPWG